MNSNSDITFNVVVVETASAAHLSKVSVGQRLEHCQVVHPDTQFGYNKFLQAGHACLRQQQADFWMIANNDIVFDQGCVRELARALEQFDSVSPWAPGHHEDLFPQSSEQSYFIGYRTSYELCGWCLMFGASLLQAVDFHKLFPSEFDFWFQDNYYGLQLRRHGLTHALVRDACAEHLFSASHELIDDSERERLTTCAQSLYIDQSRVFQSATDADYVMTIGVVAKLDGAICQTIALCDQIRPLLENLPIQLIVYVDCGRFSHDDVRDYIAMRARGRFTIYLNGQDEISDDLIQTLVDVARADPNADFIAFETAGKSRSMQPGAKAARSDKKPLESLDDPAFVFRTDIVRDYAAVAESIIEGNGIPTCLSVSVVRATLVDHRGNPEALANSRQRVSQSELSLPVVTSTGTVHRDDLHSLFRFTRFANAFQGLRFCAVFDSCNNPNADLTSVALMGARRVLQVRPTEVGATSFEDMLHSFVVELEGCKKCGSSFGDNCSSYRNSL